jgi:predicted nucleotidyltransferase
MEIFKAKKYQDLIQDEKVLNVYLFGSHVYGTNHENSDIDVILVAKTYFDSKDVNIHVYTQTQFQSLLDKGEIQMLECFFAPKAFVLKETVLFKIEFNKTFSENLRIAISTICSNSWVKGKKKLIIQGDYDLNLALKSVFHSLRILDYGIQISENQQIINFKSCNWILTELKKLALDYQYDALWNQIEIKFRKVFNDKSSKFKNLNPKNIQEVDKRKAIENILKSFGIENAALVEKLLEIKI